MTDQRTGVRTSVGLLDIATRLPGLLRDAPVMLRAALAGLTARPTAKTSIGKVFQDRAARYGDRVFLRFEDQRITYREANEIANRYAAVLAARGVGHGDVVGVMLRNCPQTVLLMLGIVKCGAIAGMLNYNQRGDVLAHSIGLLGAKTIVAETDFVEPITESRADVGDRLMTLDELDRLAATAPTQNPATTAAVLAKDKAFYIFTSGTTGLPKASVMTHYRWLRALAGFGGLGLRLRSNDTLYCCLPLYHNNALTVAVGSTVNAGATLALGRSFSASRFWDEVIRYRATAFIYIGEICGYLLNQPAKTTDRQHNVRVIIGNGLRPAIWDEFQQRFGIARICEFYAASEGNTAFVNVFNIDKSTGICPSPIAFVEYDPDTGEPVRDENGRVRKVKRGEPGLLLSKVSSLQPFDGYTDPAASEKKLVRNAFRDGDVWFNTGDLMRSQGFGHAAFTDRLGDTFRWKGENVATTEVEAAVVADPQVEEVTAFGVEVPGAGGRAGMVALRLREGAEFDGKSLAKVVYDRLPGYAIPLFARVVGELAYTSTFKSQKTELRKQGYTDDPDHPVYVLAGRDEGYVPFYDDYPAEVAAGKRPKN
ncbi:AMP-binding enzyme family protein [Mycolicibacterium hassiacum DSM 44199]|jgi:fatty-acyl-CoA synthase|uniref:AMP-binding enzyme family protein n=1 Tax=Mycolicibacterium hassiacum (strain DSM 44199 / CIP 105218 / JCM 12690 / 3849) TaxID=1122247 RepID=K5BAT6_MYCHD|nr:long-chain-acyl-CoA synthetase FadD6 [Mycolicibacterium hassiacum]EKF22805.1 AMP-binding enzyme family protein [Mycolicibacterium hassiacum DSM 44199]MBX5488281.1 long-chain-acyl-CoA synthetase [Mycolicibacterium hassiacum]MDA4084123.1 long-chain acyl-CoA synthetase [Mycolicibacterium hassiacum DSM 44199]VCT91133.1 Long-chain-fatty-acid--CoA ligase FadD17 [Mycolicibacterium hassiacum DSM 44199]